MFDMTRLGLQVQKLCSLVEDQFRDVKRPSAGSCRIHLLHKCLACSRGGDHTGRHGGARQTFDEETAVPCQRCVDWLSSSLVPTLSTIQFPSFARFRFKPLKRLMEELDVPEDDDPTRPARGRACPDF